MRTHQKSKPGDFRLIRAFSDEHNIKRLKKHIAKLKRKLRGDRFMQVIRLKNDRRRRAVE